MVSLSDARILGGIGSILIVLTVVPNIGWLFGVAGLVMALLAVSSISKAVNDRGMYTDMLTALVIGVGAIAVAAITVFGAVYQVFQANGFFTHPFMGNFSRSSFFTSHAPALAMHAPTLALIPGSFLGLALTVIGGILVAWALLVVSAVFVRRSYNAMAAKLNIERFRTCGTLYLIGAGTAIVGVGLVLIFVAEILLAVSYFSMAEETTALGGPAKPLAPVA